MQDLAKNFILSAGIVLEKDGKYLLVQENKEIVRGLWCICAGRAEEGEKVEETVVREAKEELNYDIEPGRKIGVFSGNSANSQVHVFEAKIIGGELKFPEDEIMDVKWFALEEIESMADKLRHKWIPEVIRQAQR